MTIIEDGLKKLGLCVSVNVSSPEQQQWSHVIPNCAQPPALKHHNTARDWHSYWNEGGLNSIPKSWLPVTVLKYKTIALHGAAMGWRHVCHCQQRTKCELYQQNEPTTKSEHKLTERIPAVARSKAWVCCRSLAGIAGSNPTGNTDVCLLRVLCVVT